MTAPKTYIVDANVILRFFLNDHAKHSLAAKNLLQKASDGKLELQIPFITILEVVFTLGSFYKQPRKKVATEMAKLLSARGIKSLAPDWVLDALEEYGTNNISFGDACITAEARVKKLEIASFDADFDKLRGVKRVAL